MQTYKVIDLNSYPRRAHFAYFRDFAQPCVGVTADVDMTELSAWRGDRPFFLTVLYVVMRAVNRVPELRRRIRDGQIVEFTHTPASYTVLRSDGTYVYCRLDACSLPYEAYIAEGKRCQAQALCSGSIEETETLDLTFVSGLPWLSFTAITHPMTVPADSNVRITWGRAFRREGRTLLPLNIQVHHALADGYHLAQFYRFLDEEMAALCSRKNV